MEPLKSNAEVRRSSRLSLRRQLSADPNVAIRNETGVPGQLSKGNPNDGEIGPNDIIMETQAESEIKLEYDSTIESTIETCSASCIMDVFVEEENCQVVKAEPLELDIVLVEEERDIPVDEMPLADGNLQQEEAVQCSSGDEHWCIWRKKFTEMQKKLEMVEDALTTVKSVLSGKQQDNSRSENASTSRKKRPRMEDELPVVADEMVLEERLSQQLDNSYQDTSMNEAPVFDQNPDSEHSLDDTTALCQNRERRTRGLNLHDNTTSWLKCYYSSPEFSDILEKDKVSALLPGVLQVVKENCWKDCNFDDRYERVNRVPKFELQTRDLLNCRLVCQAWKKSVDMNLCNDAFFDDYDWMDANNFLTGPADLRSPFPYSERFRLHSRKEKVLPFTLNLNSSDALIKFTRAFDSREPKVNPLLNRFLMLSGPHSELEETREDYNIWYKILDRVGQFVWHLILKPAADTPEDWWSNCLAECLQRTPNLKTLQLFGVKTEGSEKGERVLHFPNLPQLRVIQCHGVAQTVMQSLLQSNTQVERLGLCIRVHKEHEEEKESDSESESDIELESKYEWELESESESVLIGDLQTIGLTKLTNVAVQVLVENLNCNRKALKEIHHLLRHMKHWPITKLDLRNMKGVGIDTLENIVRKMKVFSRSLTHFSIRNLSVYEEYEVIPLKECLPKLEQMGLHLIVNLPKPPEPTWRGVRKSSPSHYPFCSSWMKVEVPKNLKVMLIDVTEKGY